VNLWGVTGDTLELLSVLHDWLRHRLGPVPVA
jgi:hypothetical protein